MPATTVTKELFPKATITLAQVQAERNLRIAAGAIRSTIDDQSDPANFILITEFNVIGQNDDQSAPPAHAAAAAPPAAGAGAPAASTTPPGGGGSNSILADFHGNGASANTAAQDHLPPGADASRTMAKTDLGRVTALKDRFNAAAALTGLPPALLGAIASRESRCGNILASDGTGDFGNGFGVMQVDKRSHTIAGPARPQEPGAYQSGIRHPEGCPGGDDPQVPDSAARSPASGGGRRLQLRLGRGVAGRPDAAIR